MSLADRLATFKAGPATPVAPVAQSVFVPEDKAAELETLINSQPDIVDGALDQAYKLIDKKQVSGRKTTGTVVVYASTRYAGRLKVVLTGSLMGILDGFDGSTPA